MIYSNLPNKSFTLHSVYLTHDGTIIEKVIRTQMKFKAYIVSKKFCKSKLFVPSQGV